MDEVKSSRERTPEYCTNSNSGRCCGGICAKKQRSEGGHYRPFWWGSFCCPKMKGGSQNNVQPLVSPWSWDYTLLLPEDTGAVWRSFSHTCWVRPTAFTYKPRGSAHINIPWLRQCLTVTIGGSSKWKLLPKGNWQESWYLIKASSGLRGFQSVSLFSHWLTGRWQATKLYCKYVTWLCWSLQWILSVGLRKGSVFKYLH